MSTLRIGVTVHSGWKLSVVYVDGIYLGRNRGGEFENVVILVAISIIEDRCRSSVCY